MNLRLISFRVLEFQELVTVATGMDCGIKTGFIASRL
jgi:hypothetical protein